jgi:hypothetical protein
VSDDVTASIAAAPATPGRAASGGPRAAGRLEALLWRVHPAWTGLALFLVALVVYVASNPGRTDFYDHFVWQAQAFLEGRAEIAWPVETGPFQNGYFQDVMPTTEGRGLLPFPPLPAILLMPAVAVFGLATNGAMVAALVGALNVALCWWMLVAATPRRDAALLGSLFYGFGTVAWYASMLGTTWFLAHVAASTFLFLGIATALRADPAATDVDRTEDVDPLVDPDRRDPPETADGTDPGRLARRGPYGLDLRQVAAGLLFGMAALARLTTILGAPFFALVGGGGSTVRRALGAGVGALVPVALLVAYNLATTGQVVHPAYHYLYRVEYRPVPALVHEAWAIEDPRYIPQNALIMLAWPPETPLADDPACAGGAAAQGLGLLLDRTCPMLRPDSVGMSLILTSPAYLLAIPMLLSSWRRRVVAGAGLAVLAIGLVDLMHFSQGWVQFGYRFSNDFAPFAVLLVCLAIARLGVRPLTVGLVGLSILVNAWGVYWGVTLGW